MQKKIILFIAFIFFLFQNQSVYALSDKVYKELSTFSKVLDIVDKLYVKPVNEKKTIKGAINGMLASLDPHTIYLPAKIYKTFSTDTKGRFEIEKK